VAFAIKVLVSTAVLSWIAYGIDLESLSRSLQHIQPLPLIAAGLLLSALTFLQAWRWGFVLRALNTELSWLARVINCFIGQFFNQTLPSTIGGDAIRIWLLNRAGFALRPSANSVFIDRLGALFALLLLSLLGLPWLGDMDPDGAAVVTVAGAASIGLCAMAGILVLDWLPPFLSRARIIASIATLSTDGRRVVFKTRAGFIVLAASIVLHLCVAAAVWMIAYSLQVDVTLGQCLVLVPLVMVASAIPISVAGWGVREGAMVAALGLVGVAHAEAFAISLLLGLTLIVVGLPGGLLWLRSRPPSDQTKSAIS